MHAAALTTRDIPRLLRELREQVQSETRRPVSTAVNRLSDAIELASATLPKIAFAEDSPWHKYRLCPKEAELCAILHAHLGKTVHRDSIMEALYGGHDKPEPKIVDVLVSKAKRKLGDDYSIENEHSFGYRLVWTRKWGNPRDVVEWRGIFMGRKAALMAEALFTSMGQFLHTRELALAAGAKANAVGKIMAGLGKNLIGTPYAAENVRSAGYRMVKRKIHGPNCAFHLHHSESECTCELAAHAA